MADAFVLAIDHAHLHLYPKGVIPNMVNSLFRVPVLWSLTYIGTASRTTTRDEHKIVAGGFD